VARPPVARALPALLLAAALAACSGPAPRHAPRATTTTAPGPTTTPAPGPQGAEWTTYGGSPARTSADTAEPARAGPPSEAWTSPSLDGAVYGEPLVFGGQVLVGTENDTVYALSARTGTVAWSVHLGDPVPAGALPCGDIEPTVGITSTMVVDPATRTLFASAATWDGSAVRHVLVALGLDSHAVRWRRDLDQPGWSSPAQLQRAGLALDGDEVLVGFGGNYGDCGRYTGWLVGVPASGSGGLATYRVPTAREGAVWAPPGPAVDGSGDVYLATGNGAAGPGQAFDHGNSVIELSPALAELGYFAPAAWARDSASDLDLGSTSPVLLGGGLAFQVGKQATGYLLSTTRLGGIGAALSSLPLCNSRGATAYRASALFVVCSDDGTIDQVLVHGTQLARGWTWRSPTGGSGSATVAGGELWALDHGASRLYGVDPASGATAVSLALRTGTLSPFAGVSAGEGLLVVAGARAVEAFH
jgi:outer membrane protein assembly factor BamB